MANAMQDIHTKQTHLPCESCGSSDALTKNEDGSTYCFSCQNYTKSDVEQTIPSDLRLLSGIYADIKGRGIDKKTCQKWGVEFVKKDGEYVIAFPYYSESNKKIAQKLRTTDKKFSFIGETKNPPLFGQNLWSKGKKIVITEGEIDALSVGQAQNNQWPVVSLPNGAQSAKKAITQNLRWLEDNFEEIILMFDMDEPGQQAAQQVAPLFSPGRCKIAKLPLKDANECLVQGRSKELIDAIWNAQTYRPDGIVTIADVLPKLDEKPSYGLDLPWDTLTELTYGLKSPSLWVWTSGSGMGKTEFFKDIAAHLIRETNTKIGLVFLEEETQDTVVDLAGKVAGKCFNSPDVKFDTDERDQTIKTIQDSNLVYMYDHFGHDDYDAVRSVIRHMVVACGCELVFLDHITAFTDGTGAESNALAERMMRELASMTRELKFNLQVISHVRKSDNSRKPAEEGGRVKIDDLKGSGAVKQWANMVLALERNQQAEDEDEARTTTVRLLKARGVGKNVGKTIKVKYLPETAQLVEVDEDIEFEDTPF